MSTFKHPWLSVILPDHLLLVRRVHISRTGWRELHSWVGQDLGKICSEMISSFALPLLALLVTGAQGAPRQESECCQEKRVGDTFYTLIDSNYDSFDGEVPERCLNSCFYTITGTSEPKFCFARGELPVECGASGYGSGYGLEYGSGYGSGYGMSSGKETVTSLRTAVLRLKV